MPLIPGERSCERSIRRTRPDDALILFLDGAEAFVHESLDTLSFVRLGRVDVAFGVGRDAVDPEELSRLTATVAETCEELQRLPVENIDLGVLAVGQVDESLLRILRERDVPHRPGAQRILRNELLFDELSVRREHLNAVVDAVAYVEQVVVSEHRAVDRIAKLL